MSTTRYSLQTPQGRTAEGDRIEWIEVAGGTSDTPNRALVAGAILSLGVELAAQRPPGAITIRLVETTPDTTQAGGGDDTSRVTWFAGSRKIAHTNIAP